MSSILDIHPFIKPFIHNGFYNNLPPQMIKRSEKLKNPDKFGISPWQKRTMDTFETIARLQYFENRKLIDNERLLNGEFIPSDYGLGCEDCDESFLDPLNQLVADGSLPHFIKHYDILSTPIRTQIEEFMQHPDSFHIVGQGEKIQSDKMQVQSDMLHAWLQEEIELGFQSYLQSQGIDVNQEFETAEEKQAFDEQINSIRKERTPREIGDYMKYDYRHYAELWGEFELEDQKDRFNLAKLRREEFKDLLINARRFRHIHTTPYGLSVTKVNPVNVFYHKSPNVEYVQDGDYVGRIYLATASDIIDNLGYKLTEDQIKSFERHANLQYNNPVPTTDLFGNKVDYLSTSGNPYNKWMPSFNPYLNQIAPGLGMNVTSTSFSELWMPGHGMQSAYMFVVTEAYWKGYKREGRLCWINPESGLMEVLKVDESFIVPPYIKELKQESLASEPELNTIVWTYNVEIWEGTKINTFVGDTTTQAIYLDVQPQAYQGASSYRDRGKKLPIAGQIANNRNTAPMSQLDLFKPYQFMFNVVMNKAVKYMERSLASFVVHDLDSLPQGKDWTGKDALSRWLGIGEETGVAPYSTTSVSRAGVNASGGQFPRVIDLDMSPKILSLLQIATSIRALALAQIGFSPERLGDVTGTDTATGINTAVAKSYNATGSWFTDFYECERDILKMQLDAAQWLQSQNKDYTAQFSKSIFSEGFLKQNFNDFDLYDLRIYITNSQEELRKLQLYKQLAIENNTVLTKMSSRMEMVGMNNAELILNVIKQAEEEALEREQQMQSFAQQQQQAATELERIKIQKEEEMFYAELDNRLREAWIRSRGFLGEGEQDIDSSGIPDAFEYAKFSAKAQSDLDSLGLSRDKLQLEIQKEAARRAEKQKEFDLKQQDQALKQQEIQQTAKNVKILGDKSK